MKWLAGILFLLLAALVLESGLLAYSMYVLLGVLLLSRFLARNWIEHLTAKRTCDRTTAEVGDTVSINIAITNNSALPVPWVILDDLLPAKDLSESRLRLRVKKKRMKIVLIGGHSQADLDYQIEFRMRGYYQLGPLVLESGDLFGLHRRYRVGTEPSFVLVYPRVVPLEGYDVASRAPIGEVRMTHRLYEDPTRIAGVRGYESGDPLNRIHWRATARMGTLHCKVYEPSTIAGATLVLDFHEHGYDENREPQRSELAITATASLANAVYELGQQIGLVTNGRDAADRIRTEGWDHDYRTRDAAQKSVEMREKSDRLRPLIVETRRGVEQFQRILETLARVELSDGLTLPQLITECTSRLPRNATVIAVLSECTPEIAIALGTLRRRGFAVSAMLVVFAEDPLIAAHALLMAEGIEIRSLPNEQALPAICQRQMLR
ncbi:MAG: DUF58 domain-containing protein [Planctomycetes bacterium]|nr:DUF58 domain-containing protein [Planctomycetota bacterium]